MDLAPRLAQTGQVELRGGKAFRTNSTLAWPVLPARLTTDGS